MLLLRAEWGISAAEAYGPGGLPAWEVALLVAAAEERMNARGGGAEE